MSYPQFLPPILNLSGSWDEILRKLYFVFESDFKDHQTTHIRLHVIYDGRVLPDGEGKEEGFWHVISKMDRKSGKRFIDYRRAERLPWARPLMESPPRNEIKVFDYDHVSKDKGIRRYIWIEDFDYVVILQRKKNVYYLVTAFYVYSLRSKKNLQHRYEDRL